MFVSDDRESARDAMRPYVALYVGGMGSRKQNFYNALVQRYGFEDAAREVQDLYLEGKKEEAAAALPGELIDTVSLCGPADVVRERIGIYRDAGVGTLMVAPMAWTFEDRMAQLRHVAELAVLRVFLGAFGDAGPRVPHARAGDARWSRAGTRCTSRRGSAGARTPRRRASTSPTRPSTRSSPPRRPSTSSPTRRRSRPRARPARWWPGSRPDVAVADIMTPAAALAAELAGVPVATLIPHVYPHMAPGFPIYSIGARLPRTRLGARLWERANERFVEPALRQGRDQLNESRRRLGLPPRPWVHTMLSHELTLVATLPQLEYPREWPAWARSSGR